MSSPKFFVLIATLLSLNIIVATIGSYRPQPHVGRYQYCESEEDIGGLRVLILDTATGRVEWSKVASMPTMEFDTSPTVLASNQH